MKIIKEYTYIIIAGILVGITHWGIIILLKTETSVNNRGQIELGIFLIVYASIFYILGYMNRIQRKLISTIKLFDDWKVSDVTNLTKMFKNQKSLSGLSIEKVNIYKEKLSKIPNWIKRLYKVL